MPKPGDIIVVVWPKSGGGIKRKFAVVISSDQYNAQGNDVILVNTTSKTHRAESEDYLIPKSHPDFQQTGFSVETVVRCGKFYTFDTTQKWRPLGTLSPTLFSEVTKRCRDAIAT